ERRGVTEFGLVSRPAHRFVRLRRLREQFWRHIPERFRLRDLRGAGRRQPDHVRGILMPAAPATQAGGREAAASWRAIGPPRHPLVTDAAPPRPAPPTPR